MKLPTRILVVGILLAFSGCKGAESDSGSTNTAAPVTPPPSAATKGDAIQSGSKGESGGERMESSGRPMDRKIPD